MHLRVFKNWLKKRCPKSPRNLGLYQYFIALVHSECDVGLLVNKRWVSIIPPAEKNPEFSGFPEKTKNKSVFNFWWVLISK